MCVVIPTSQIIQPGFFVEHIPSIAEGVQLTEGSGQGAGGGERFAPGIIRIPHHGCARIIQNGNDIALEVMDVGELLGGGAVIPFHHGGLAGGCMFLFAVYSVFPAMNRLALAFSTRFSKGRPLGSASSALSTSYAVLLTMPRGLMDLRSRCCFFSASVS